MKGPRSKALQIIIEHCKETQKKCLEALVNCPVDSDTFEEVDHKLLAERARQGPHAKILSLCERWASLVTWRPTAYMYGAKRLPSHEE